MKVFYPNHKELTPEELQELEKFRTIIERATADGVITRGERETITAAMYADNKVTVQELAMIRTLIQEKVATGEIKLDYS
ncbi:MAG: hypothetical protein F6K36_18110 [Symploca sp. SIO3C6]|uniref:TerB family tellurite resistance protein n=1 Tax=Symploca sp. SIO1C4 TaxID=2607765 RepID=A0A6B3N305_9CYAN|nr:hypothetical protein [Symploca sp. SIO3C6]NER28076.1 hypothetical protein [Symploca sp. SIO1C4]NET06911.1 hypothetical protein [Symploca sp. SIO2B6]